MTSSLKPPRLWEVPQRPGNCLDNTPHPHPRVSFVLLPHVSVTPVTMRVADKTAFGQESTVLPECWHLEQTCFAFHQPCLWIISSQGMSSQTVAPQPPQSQKF